MVYRILSLDGGGMKGVFTARVLERLARERRSLVSRVDLLAGTSTGGVLALGLAAGRTPGRLRRLYRRKGKHIFDDSIWDDLIDMGNATGADYDHDGLEDALKGEFGNQTLKTLEKRVLVPTFDLDARATRDRPRTWKPKFFHNFPGPDSDGDERVRDVAVRTCCAPTYFPAYQGYVDGGVVANNPSVAALAQALHEGLELREVALLSIGTGAEPKFVRGSPDWGWGQWARPLVSLMIHGVMGVADFQCRQLLRERYHRLDPYLSRGVGLDDAREETLDWLEAAADELDLAPELDWLEAVGW